MFSPVISCSSQRLCNPFIRAGHICFSYITEKNTIWAYPLSGIFPKLDHLQRILFLLLIILFIIFWVRLDNLVLTAKTPGPLVGNLWLISMSWTGEREQSQPQLVLLQPQPRGSAATTWHHHRIIIYIYGRKLKQAMPLWESRAESSSRLTPGIPGVTRRQQASPCSASGSGASTRSGIRICASSCASTSTSICASPCAGTSTRMCASSSAGVCARLTMSYACTVGEQDTQGVLLWYNRLRDRSNRT